MTLFWPKQYALVKTESDIGVDASPDLSNRLEAVNEFSPEPYAGDTATYNELRPYLGASPEVNVAPNTALSITVPLVGSGSAGSPPAFGALLRACGLAETVSTSSVVYNPISEEFETCTIYYVLDNQLHKMTNAIGTPSINVTAGDFPTIQFDMIGTYNHPEAAGQYSGTPPSQPTVIPANHINTVCSVQGYKAMTQSYVLNGNTSPTHRSLIGGEEFRITDRDSGGTVQFDAPDLSQKDFFSAVETSNGVTKGVIELTHGTQSGNTVKVTESQAQLSSISVQDQDGVAQYSMNHKALPENGNDEFTLEFS